MLKTSVVKRTRKIWLEWAARTNLGKPQNATGFAKTSTSHGLISVAMEHFAVVWPQLVLRLYHVVITVMTVVGRSAQSHLEASMVGSTATATAIMSPPLVSGSSDKQSIQTIKNITEIKSDRFNTNNTNNTNLIIGESFASFGVSMVVLSTLLFCFFRKLRIQGKDAIYTMSVCGGKRKTSGDNQRTMTLSERSVPMGTVTPPPEYDLTSPVDLPGDSVETCSPLSPLPQAHTVASSFTQLRRSDSYDRSQLCPTGSRNPFEVRHFEEVSPFTTPFPTPLPSRSASPCPSISVDSPNSTNRHFQSQLHGPHDREGCFVAKCQTITCCSRSASPAPSATSARIITIALDHAVSEQVRRRTSTTHVYEMA